MLSKEERSARARRAAHAMWAKMRSGMREPDPEAIAHNAEASAHAREELDVLQAQRRLVEAQAALDAARARTRANQNKEGDA